MHNSQNGNPVDPNGPNLHLLNCGSSPCVSCHSSNSNETIKILGSGASESRVPVVLCAQEPTYPPDGSSTSSLAGGNFYWLVNGNGGYDKNTLGHNVLSIPGVSEDPNTKGPPGGFLSSDKGSCGYCHGGDGSSGWLCDCTSCHVPRHHAEDHPNGNYNNVVDEDGGFYRFLGRQKDNYSLPSNVLNNIKSFHNNAGVKGVEDSSWEQNPSSSVHNEYSGETTHSGSLSGGYDSISDWCGGCHGDFHYYTNQSAVGSSSPWLRHPTDVVIPNYGEYKDAYGASGSGVGVYNPLVPVARANIDSYDGSGPSSQVNIGTDQVQCLSCHRPHGTPYPDMLRWDYTKMVAGGGAGCDVGNGCFVCHTKKDE